MAHGKRRSLQSAPQLKKLFLKGLPLKDSVERRI